MHSCFIYGCTINSSIPLGEGFAEGSGEASIEICADKLTPEDSQINWFHHIGEQQVLSRFGQYKNSFYVELPGLSFYEIASDGSKINFTPLGDYSLSEQQGLFLTQIIPLALSLQGKLVLHASAVKCRDKAVCFLGTQGMGKSTLAAACVADGMELISDDALVAKCGAEGEAFVESAYPELRISPKVADDLFGSTYKLNPMFSKVRVSISDLFFKRATPLKTIYVLSKADKISIQKCKVSEVLEEILSNTFRIDLLDNKRITEEFSSLSSLLEKVSIRKLSYPRKLSSLPDLVSFIKSNLG